jgi:hypothetical protein
MQFQASGPFNARAVAAAPLKPAACQQCGRMLGDQRILTRDECGLIRRFCPELACIEAWRCDHGTAFRLRPRT